MEQAMFPQNENNTPFDNEALFDAEGHLTDEGLHALQESRLDELGSLETAEHLPVFLESYRVLPCSSAGRPAPPSFLPCCRPPTLNSNKKSAQR